MRYLYKDGFEIGHWIFQMVGNFVHLFACVLRILTFNLIYFDFELSWVVYTLKNSANLTRWINKQLNKWK